MSGHPGDPDARSAILANVALAAVMPLTLLVAPLLIGQLIAELHFSESQAGYLLSVELASMCLSTAVALALMRRVAWPRIVAGCLVVAIIGNAGSAFAASFSGLALLRIITGVGSGTIMAMCLAAIGASRNKDRNFGLWLISQLLSGVIGLLVLSWVFRWWGIAGFFLGVAAFQATLLFAARSFFDGSRVSRQSGVQGHAEGSISLIAIAGLFAILLIYVAIGGVWAYVERIGRASNIGSSSIGTILAVATAMGIVGAGTASILGGRSSRSLPMLIGFLIVMAAMASLLGQPNEFRYAIAAGFFKFAWTFLIPFMLAGVSARDPSGRLITISNLVLGGGLAIGPAVSALILRSGGSYDALVVVMLFVAGASALVCLLPTLSSERTLRRSRPA